MKERLLFISGGSWSGKTERASKLASQAEDVVWIGTAAPSTREFADRINLLKSSRPPHWITYDSPFDLAEALSNARKNHPHALIVIDSVSQWLGNEIARSSGKLDEQQLSEAVARDVEEFSHMLSRDRGAIIVVSSDFGASPPPQEQAARVLRMCVGRANQSVARVADHVELMMSGIVFSSSSKSL